LHKIKTVGRGLAPAEKKQMRFPHLLFCLYVI